MISMQDRIHYIILRLHFVFQRKALSAFELVPIYLKIPRPYNPFPSFTPLFIPSPHLNMSCLTFSLLHFHSCLYHTLLTFLFFSYHIISYHILYCTTLHFTALYCRDLDPSCIPVSESLQDTMERTLPLLTQKILPDIKKGKTVLVVAHANSLRGAVLIPSCPALPCSALFYPALLFSPLYSLLLINYRPPISLILRNLPLLRCKHFCDSVIVLLEHGCLPLRMNLSRISFDHLTTFISPYTIITIVLSLSSLHNVTHLYYLVLISLRCGEVHRQLVRR